MIFQIGDRVLVDMRANGRCDYEAECVNGMTGTIVLYDGRPGIRFDQKFDGGHDLGGVCEYGFGRWVSAGSLILIDEMDDVEINDDDFTMILSKESDLTPDDPFAGKYFHSEIGRLPECEGRWVVRTIRRFGKCRSTKYVVKFDGVRAFQIVDESELVVKYGNKKCRRVS